MKKQQIDNQKGEIEFRKKLYKHQIENISHFEDECDADEITQILKERMEYTRKQISELKKKKIALSPYIELGAERCQRSLVMENDLGLNGGAAVDISFDMLKSCDHYSDIFGKKNVPTRICCDVNNLPFLSNSLPFAFCYEFLHHFPDPFPVVNEIHRVLLPGGYFFFDEEPFKQILKLNLFKHKKHSQEEHAPGKLQKIIDRFFSLYTNNETSYGIIENEKISLKSWKNALCCFENKSVQLSSFKNVKPDLFQPESYLKYIIALLSGGSLSGLCQKKGYKKSDLKNIYDILICPSCNENCRENILLKSTNNYSCPECHTSYPEFEGVVFLFSPEKIRELYPERILP